MTGIILQNIKKNSVVNAADYGAKGDLVYTEPTYETVAITSGTDTTNAIQAALNKAGSLVSSNINRDFEGNAICYIPEGNYIVTQTLIVPPNVVLHAEGWLYNFIADAYTPIVKGSRHSHCRKLQVHANAKTGVLWGDLGSSPCASNLESIVVWHCGVGYDSSQSSNNQKCGLRLRGLDFRIGHVWIKGGNIGLHGDGASDVLAANVFPIGCAVGIKIDSGEQWSLKSVTWDTNINVNLVIDNSNNIAVEGESFVQSNAFGTPIRSAMIIGEYTGSQKPNSNIRVKLAAQSTGGYGAILSNMEDCAIALHLTNSRTFAQTGGDGTANSHWTPVAGALLPHNNGTNYFYNNGNPVEKLGAAIKYVTGFKGFLDINIEKDYDIVLSEGTQYGSIKCQTDKVFFQLLNGNLVNHSSKTSNKFTPWIDLPLANNWVAYGLGWSPPQFRKNNGLVELKGLIKKASAPTIYEGITYLPISCRPIHNKAIGTVAYDGSNFNFASCSMGTNGVLNYFNGAYNWYSLEFQYSVDIKTALFFGDSITQGTGASSSTYRWSTLVANQLIYLEDNQGIGGTVLQNSAPALANNGRDRYIKDVINNLPDKVFILYGLNDLRYNGTEFSATKFQANLEEIIQGVLNSNIPPESITVGSPPYMNPANYGDSSPANAGTITKHLQYVTATRLAAAKFGVRWGNVYQAMIDNGGNSLLSSDGVHPNDAGHQVIANTMLNSTFI